MKLSIFTILLGLIRVDVLIVVIPLIIFKFSKLVKQDKINTIFYLILFSSIYFIFMFLSGVYPIPTTFYSKILTMKLNISNGIYFDVFFDRLSDYFNSQLVIVLILYITSIYSIIYFVFSKYKIYTIYMLILLIGLLLVDANKPSWFLWYFENYIVINLSIFLVIILGYFDNFSYKDRRLLYSSPLIIFFTLSIYSNIHNNRDLPWNVNGPFFNGYSHLKDYYIAEGDGLFKFPGVPAGYVVISEIGIVSYFGGSGFLIGDRLGLVQPGFFEKIITSKFSFFYPNSVLISIEDALKDKTKPIYMVWGGVSDGKYCSTFISERKLCINKLDNLDLLAQSLKKE